MPSSFWRAFAGPLCIAVAIVGLLALVLRDQTAPPDPCDRTCVAQGQASKHHRETADSLARVAAIQETVYVARRAASQKAVAAIPPVSVVGDTIVLAVGRFLVAHPVAVVITKQREAIDSLTGTVASGGALISTLHREIAQKDSAFAAADSAHAIERRNWTASQPSKWSRAWDRVKAPLALVAGVIIGVQAAR